MSAHEELKRFIRNAQDIQRDVDRLTNHDSFFDALMVDMGKCAGALTREANRAKLAEALHQGRLRPGYVVLLRDLLNEVLVASGVEGGNAE